MKPSLATVINTVLVGVTIGFVFYLWLALVMLPGGLHFKLDGVTHTITLKMP